MCDIPGINSVTRRNRLLAIADPRFWLCNHSAWRALSMTNCIPTGSVWDEVHTRLSVYSIGIYMTDVG